MLILSGTDHHRSRQKGSYDVNTPFDDFNDDLFPTNSAWDRPGQGHIRRVTTPIPVNNHQDPTTIGAFGPFTSLEQGSTFSFFELAERRLTTNDLSAYSVPFPDSSTTSEDHEGKAHATGHIIDFK